MKVWISEQTFFHFLILGKSTERDSNLYFRRRGEGTLTTAASTTVWPKILFLIYNFTGKSFSEESKKFSQRCLCRKSFSWSDAGRVSRFQVNHFLNGPTSAPFSFIFSLFKQTIQFLLQINVKNVMSIQYTAPGFEPTTSRT